MAPYIEFETIKNRVSIESAAEMLGLTMKRKGSEMRSACPACKRGGDRALQLTLSGQYQNSFTCWATEQRGDVINFVAHIRGYEGKPGQLQAAEEIARHFGLETTPHKTPGPPKAEPEGRRELTALDYLDALHEAVKALGISPASADEIGIGYANKGYLRGRVGVPVYLPTGELLGYFGIAPGADVIFNKSIDERAGNVVELRKKTV